MFMRVYNYNISKIYKSILNDDITIAVKISLCTTVCPNLEVLTVYMSELLYTEVVGWLLCY